MERDGATGNTGPEGLSAWLWRALRPEFVVPAALTAASVFSSLAVLDHSTYWLDYDTPTQPVEALELSAGCWDYASGKPGVILALTAVYLLFGPSPLAETVVLAGLAALSALAVYFLAQRLSRSRAVAAAAGLGWLALPAQMYYSRTHMGYPMAWLTLGVLAFVTRRWRLAGILLMLAMMSHGTFAVPVGLFLGASILCRRGPAGRSEWFRFAGFLLLPWLLFETLSYAFTGVPFEWTLGTIRWYFVYQNTLQPTNWLHVWESLRLANGTAAASLLAVSALYPFVRSKRDRAGLPLYLTAWGMLGLYTIRAGLTHGRFIPRAISGAYPLLAVLAACTLGAMLQRWEIRRPVGFNWPGFRPLILGALSLAVGASLTQNLLIVREFSQTGYPVIEAAFQDAAHMGRPIRYFGNEWVGLYFGKLYGVETAVDDPDVEVAAADTQAVLIFEDDSLGMREELAYRRGLYNVSAAAHRRTNLWPAGVESEMATADMPTLRQHYLEGPAIGMLEIWQPIEPAGTFEAHTRVSAHTRYYPGTGCIVPPRYGDKTLHWYQLVLLRFREALGVA